MDKAKRWFVRRPSYQQLIDNDGAEATETTSSGLSRRSSEPSFKPIAYGVFLLLGVAMLWPWNSFMSAAPYFQLRFKSNSSILNNFQAAELSVSTATNLASVWILAKLQTGASYSRRIIASLIVNTLVFVVVAISTRAALDISTGVYLAFLMTAVFTASLATGFMQNGAFAYVAGLQRPEYMQAILLGQAVAGVLPPLVQMASVLSASRDSQSGQGTSASAFVYFLTAAVVSAVTLTAFVYLKTYHAPAPTRAIARAVDDEQSEEDPLDPSIQACDLSHKRSVPLTYLARRLFFSGAAIFLTFGITMSFPVFTQEILTTNPNPPPLLRDASFIPLALLVWNVGDLVGRLLPLAPWLSLAHRPKILFLLALARVTFIPLYLLCNIVAVGASSPTLLSAPEKASKAMPDGFYFLVVQLPFGVSNGYLGSCCMMGAGRLVNEDESEAAGAFMGLLLVAGLAVGSLCSFFIGNA